MSSMVHCDFEKGSQNQHFQSAVWVGIREGGRSQKKSMLCTSLDREGGGHKNEYAVYFFR